MSMSEVLKYADRIGPNQTSQKHSKSGAAQEAHRAQHSQQSPGSASQDGNQILMQQRASKRRHIGASKVAELLVEPQ